MEKPTQQELLQIALDAIHKLTDRSMLINLQNAVNNQLQRPSSNEGNTDTITT